MKKIIITLLAMTLTTAAYSQMHSGGFKIDDRSAYYGMRLGFNSAHIGGDLDTDSRTSLNVGAVAGIKCSEDTPLFLELGIYYAGKGAKIKDRENSTVTKVGMDYIEIPLLMKYGFEVTPEFAVIPYIGPSLAVGLGGQMKTSTPTNAYKVDTFDKDTFKRLDVGIKFGCGFEWNMIYAELGYQWGVINISQDDFNDAFNRNFYMNIGVNF